MKCYEDIIYLTLNTKITNSLCEVRESVIITKLPRQGWVVQSTIFLFVHLKYILELGKVKFDNGFGRRFCCCRCCWFCFAQSFNFFAVNPEILGAYFLCRKLQSVWFPLNFFGCLVVVKSRLWHFESFQGFELDEAIFVRIHNDRHPFRICFRRGHYKEICSGMIFLANWTTRFWSWFVHDEEFNDIQKYWIPNFKLRS